MKSFDILVVGKGLIGTAAAKYLSMSGAHVALVGPGEERALNEGIIFASHYDQSRVQRIIGKDDTWTQLDHESAMVYKQLEHESGITFHSHEGCLYINPYGEDEYLVRAKASAPVYHDQCTFFTNGEELNKSFPGYNFPRESHGLYERSPSGHINPRKLIQAQMKIFENNKGSFVEETVNKISINNDDCRVTTISGQHYISKIVLLATGSFSNFFDLLPRKLSLKLKGELTTWAQVSDEDAKILSALPSLLYEMDEPDIQNLYLVKPLLYPDGNYYIKAGANFTDDPVFKSIDSLRSWYKNETFTAHFSLLQQTILTLLPGVVIKSWTSKKCIVCYTPHGKPYIGEVNPALFVAAGGNGYSAMCSDALGRVASEKILKGKFPAGYHENDFRIIFQQ